MMSSLVNTDPDRIMEKRKRKADQLKNWGFDSESYISFISKSYKYCIWVIFALCNFLNLQTLSPHLEFAQTQLSLKKNNMRYWKSLSYVCLLTTRAKGVKVKKGRIFACIYST